MKQNLIKLAVLILGMTILSAMGLFEWWTGLIVLAMGMIIFLVKKSQVFLYLGVICLLLIPLLLIFSQPAALIAGNLAFIWLVAFATVDLINHDKKV